MILILVFFIALIFFSIMKKRKIGSILMPIAVFIILLILIAGYIFMVDYDHRYNKRIIILNNNEREYKMPLKLKPFVPYQISLYDMELEVYNKIEPLDIQLFVLSNDKIISSYHTSYLDLGYTLEGNKKKGCATLDYTIMFYPWDIFKGNDLNIIVDWGGANVSKCKLEIITVYGEM